MKKIIPIKKLNDFEGDFLSPSAIQQRAAGSGMHGGGGRGRPPVAALRGAASKQAPPSAPAERWYLGFGRSRYLFSIPQIFFSIFVMSLFFCVCIY